MNNTMNTITNTRLGHKLKRFYEFLCLLTVEPYLFAFMFVLSLKKVPTDQLIQDKICRHKYALDVSYCTSLSQMSDNENYMDMKSRILTDATNFNLYSIVIMTLPSVVISLFIGSWTDTYVKAKKVLLIASAVAGILEAIILILNDYFINASHYILLVSLLPGVVSGGVLAQFMSVWSYIASTTPHHMRAIRMTFAEMAIGIATPLGTYIGGLVLNTGSMFNSGGQLHNYSGVFAITGVTYSLALLWTVYMVDEEKDIQQWVHLFSKMPDTDIDGQQTIIRNKLQTFNANKAKHPLRLLLNLGNVKQMFTTCFKRRPNHLRRQIWLLFLSMTCYMVSHIGPVFFMYQFTQKVYAWDSMTYSNGASIAIIAITAGTMIIAPILLKVFKFRDTTLSMVGLVSYFILNLVRGLVLTPAGYYYSLIGGCLGGVASIGIRSHFSKIIRLDELGKVFSGLSAIEALTPLISAALFTGIFNATMDSMPGLSLIVVAVILIIPFGVILWIHFRTDLPDFRHSVDYNDGKNNKYNSDDNHDMVDMSATESDNLNSSNHEKF